MAKMIYRRMFHSSILVDQWIYIDGGEVSYEKGINFPINETLGIDLSIDWKNSTLNLTAVPRPPTSLALNWQRLWWDRSHNIIYCFGGELSYGNEAAKNLQTPLSSIWGFTPDGEGRGAWAEVIGPSSENSFPSNILCPAAGVSTDDDFNAYYVGGFTDWFTYRDGGDPVAAPGLLTFNFESSSLSNTSDGGYQGYYRTNGQWAGPGAMLNVPLFGVEGILVMMGGAGWFNNITIFDKNAHSWLSQTATGSIPDPRSLFCAVGIQASKYSYEIFIHGGRHDTTSPNLDEVFILSLPAFRWFRANYTSVYPRFGHTCHSTQNGQMVAIGGLDGSHFHSDIRHAWNHSADPWTQGIGVFDMTALEWKDSYQTNASSYALPSAIKQYYGQNTSQYPSEWTSAEVRELFQPKSSQMSRGIKAGIVISCVPFLVVGGLVAWFLWNRKKKRLAAQGQRPSLKESSGSPMLGSVPPAQLSAVDRPWELSNSGQIFEIGDSRQLFEISNAAEVHETDS